MQLRRNIDNFNDVSYNFHLLERLLLGHGLDETHINTGAIQEKHLAVGAVTASKLDVDEIASISANLGNIKAGFVTGTTISGCNIIMGSGNNVFKATTAGIQLGHDIFASAPFRVTPTGALTATNVMITGMINATGGTFSGSISASGTISGGTISGATISGGSINIGGGRAQITSEGSLTAANGVFYVPWDGDGVFSNFNNEARWKLTNWDYIRQRLDDVAFFHDGAIRFNFDIASGHGRIRFGNNLWKSLHTLNRFQARNFSDTTYVEIEASAFTVMSSQERKRKIRQYGQGALDLVLNTKVYDYELIDDDTTDEVGNVIERSTRRRVGVLAEEAPAIIKSDDGVSLGDSIGLLWRAIQELDKKVELRRVVT